MLSFVVLLLLGCEKERSLFNRLDRNLTRQWEIRFSEEPPLVYPSSQLKADLEFLAYGISLVELVDTSLLKSRQKTRYHELLSLMTAKETALRPYRKNPAFYDLGTSLSQLLTDTTLELNNRLQQISPVLDTLSAYYAGAKENLNYFPGDKVTLSLESQRSFFLVLSENLPDSIAKSTLDPAEKERLIGKSESCRLIVADYMAFCRSQLYESENTSR